MTTAAITTTKTKRRIPGFAQLQRVGRSLMLPIAALPAAGLLLRLGQNDMLGGKDVTPGDPAGIAGTLSWMQPVADVFAAAGNAIFNNLPIIFAIGIAIGYARKADGSTGLAALMGYLVFKGVSDAMSPYVLEKAGEGETQALINYGVLGGIVIGITAALLFQKYSRIKLPQYLAFFGGRRFVPIVTSAAALVIAVIGAFLYPAFDWLINDKIGGFVTGSTILGGFIFGTLNRLLVPIGLHHLLNSMPWFQFGTFTDAGGNVWHGDIPRFLHGDPTAGAFTTGFFPIMMFALPAAALAIIHTSKSKNRKVIAGMMGSAALVAIVTGITEPLEFSFVYVAYPLYAIHAVLTGASLAICNALGIRDGFSFSAGATDFFLNLRIAEKPWMLVAIGLVFAVIYYFLFRFVITKWNLRTPGREEDGAATFDPTADVADAPAAAGAGVATAIADAPTPADGNGSSKSTRRK